MKFAWGKALILRQCVLESAIVLAVIEFLLGMTGFDFNRSQEAIRNRTMVYLFIGWLMYLVFIVALGRKGFESGGRRAIARGALGIVLAAAFAMGMFMPGVW